MESRVEHYLSEFSSLAGTLPGQKLAWLRSLRGQALERFAELGFPTPRQEDWKYTRVAPIEKRAFKPSRTAGIGLTLEDLSPCDIPGLDAHRLVFVNGVFSEELSTGPRLQKGVTLSSLASALTDMPNALEPHLARYADMSASGFSALNAAFMGEGAFLRLSAGTRLDTPILLLFVSTPQEQDACAQPRLLIVAEQDSEATVIEQYACLGESTYFNNAVTEISLGPDAGLVHYKLQDESRKAFHIATLQVSQASGSRFTSHSISLGGLLVRNDINSTLEAQGARCELNGLYLGNGRQHVDYHTRIDHAKPEGTSREYYKGVLDGRARGVFNGRVYVHPDAQKTDAEQTNNNLLLSRDAEIDTKPQLEIFADDVKCAHGATVGQLDENMVFYLRSRGIEERAARGLLTYGFASDVLARMSLEPVRARLQEQLISWLPNAEEIREIVT